MVYILSSSHLVYCCHCFPNMDVRTWLPTAPLRPRYLPITCAHTLPCPAAYAAFGPLPHCPFIVVYHSPPPPRTPPPACTTPNLTDPTLRFHLPRFGYTVAGPVLLPRACSAKHRHIQRLLPGAHTPCLHLPFMRPGFPTPTLALPPAPAWPPPTDPTFL